MSTEAQEPDDNPDFVDCSPYVVAYREAYEQLELATTDEAKAKYQATIDRLRAEWKLANEGDDNLSEIADTGGLEDA